MSISELKDFEEEVLDEEFINYSTDPDTTCTICQAEFLDAEDLTIHLQQIHKQTDGEISFKQCHFCTDTYTDFMNYAEHIRDNHLTSLKFCPYCLRGFQDYDEYRLHEKKHKIQLKKSIINCTLCEEHFGNMTQLRNHDFTCHYSEYDGVMIQEYLPYLSAALNAKAATVLQSLHMDVVYICVGCEYSTTNLTCFIEHASKNCFSFVCDKCSNVYKTKYDLSRHLSKDCSVFPNKGKTCPGCKLKFNKQMYNTHIRQCKIMKCKTCGINFQTMDDMAKHQLEMHPLAVELKTCQFCGRESVGSIALQNHIDRSHKHELHLYKYQCVTCKLVYKHPQKLFGHYFSKHKDLDPYTCKICDKKFKLRKKFTVHIKLDHKSVGFVEFDENYHVFFTEKKSPNPFIPKSIYVEEEEERENNAFDDRNTGLTTSEMSVDETEGNQTEVESNQKAKLRHKKVKKHVQQNEAEPTESVEVQSSDDEPLLVIKKRVQKTMPKLRNRWSKQELTSYNKKRFTCNICKKYCYTYQNYNHHMSLHSNKDYKKCIKCAKVFRSKEKLNKHIELEHSSSKLTDTLKKLLEKRKKGQKIDDDLPMSERFRRTIKSVKCDDFQGTATITPVENGLSVQKYIENFTPEGEIKSESLIQHAVSLKIVKGSAKQPTIKMTKFKPHPISYSQKLSMPVKFKDCYTYDTEPCVAKIRIIQQQTTHKDDTNDDYNSFNYLDNDEPVDRERNEDRNESIPEVAEEVMLEGTEETPKVVPVPHKIVIPKLPTEYKNMRIAHLLPEAPYYKIVKVDEVLNMQNENKAEKQVKDAIKLADGTKFVNTNPLAHLLGKTPIEKVLAPMRNKYYKPRVKNFQGMLAEALTALEKPPPKRRKKELVVPKVELEEPDTT